MYLISLVSRWPNKFESTVLKLYENVIYALTKII